ncbi:MAG: endolytic transglycosylase MltG [Clostridia bacterium]|nr:endolytic transglycosylase MltG [Clostridia bacterium]MBQ6892511.1 endolytic transglycosylase MltG [Clostridia bacterium]MBR0422558.1 endolytic transglycosylase MltG [Clostridia bacterium]
MTQWKDPVTVRREKIWRILRPVAAVLLSIVVVALIMTGAVRYVLSHFVYPVDPDDNTPIQVVIPSGSSASRIASLLYRARGEDEPGLIVSTASFKVYVDFTGRANSLRAGTYVLSRNMTIPEIVNILCAGNEARRVTRFTIPEGYTASQIAQALFEAGMLEDQEQFLALCKDGTLLSGGYLDPLLNASDRRFALEGYLFPDTYEVYEDAAAADILKKMLNRFAVVFTEEDANRARELNMTTDQVMTLASMIEKEAGAAEDFPRVSAVFHNRLKQGMALESCATLSYALGVKKYTFTEEELSTVSPYNTYRNKGLPVGPICNPGRAAIEAALYPSEEYMSAGFLFFCNMNPKQTNRLVFSRTYEEHRQNVVKYSPFWE